MSWMIALSLAASTSLARNPGGNGPEQVPMRLATDVPRLELRRTAGGDWSSSARTQSEEVHVHLETDSPAVELHRITGQGMGTVATGYGAATVGLLQYQRECSAPCDRLIPEPNSDFFITGKGVTRSEKFSLLGHGEDITLRVKPGSSGLMTLGAALTTLGIATTVTGLVVGVVDLLLNARSSAGAPSLGSSPTDSMMPAAGAILGGGVVFLGAGIPLMAFNGTDVKFLPGKPVSRPGREEL